MPAALARCAAGGIAGQEIERAPLGEVMSLTTGLGLADALIAATAMQLQVPLLTRNARHFQDVTGLGLDRRRI